MYRNEQRGNETTTDTLKQNRNLLLIEIVCKVNDFLHFSQENIIMV